METLPIEESGSSGIRLGARLPDTEWRNAQASRHPLEIFEVSIAPVGLVYAH